MRLHCSGGATIHELQTQFNGFFPFLKIEFTSTGHSLYQASPASSIYNNKLRLADIRRRKADIDIDLALPDTLTVGELEQQLSDQYGLYVQVFRKSGNTWVETTLTDNWTLKQQNIHGDEISNLKHEPKYKREFNPDTL